MSYSFTEDFQITIPNVEEQLSGFSESSFSSKHGLVIEVAAIHAGATANFNHYSAEALEKSLNSWLEPHPKPIIMNHDPYSEPVGRVMGAKMDQEEDGTPFVRLQVAVLDPEAIKKVSDGRYLTGSVGGKADEALCSVCNTDWASPRESRGLPCAHKRGKVYSGKVAMMDMRNITFKEYSFVNMPADANSSIRKVGEDESSDDWVRPTRFFVLDMVSEGIVEYTESAESRDVLSGLRKKDALPLYMGLKGAFLSALAVHEEELSIQDSVNIDKSDTNILNDPNLEENEMAKEAQELQDEDILAVAEGLSADLSAQAKDETQTATDEEVADEEKAETDHPAAEEADDDAVEDKGPENADEGERPEGQEKPRDKDVDPETSDGADKSREDENDDDTTEEVEESSDEADSDDTEEEADSTTELNDEAEESDVEPHVSELESKVAELETENSKLRKALHRNLVERVVDTKIALGFIDSDSRKAELEEHEGRTGQSLADSLRDLSKMEPKVSQPNTPTAPLEMSQDSEVVGNEEHVTTIGDEAELEESIHDPSERYVDLFTDILMNRKKA